MNKDPMTNLTYGVYIISSKYRNKTNACIINSCIQVAMDPTRVAISLMNTHYTRKLIKESGVFCISVLDETCPFDLIKQLGYQSGRDIDKLKDIPTFNDINGVPCILRNSCASLSVKVTDYINLDSHTVFIGKVKDCKILSDNKPLTYAYYQENLMPKDEESDSHADSSDRKIIGWRCQICGYEYWDPVIPDDFMCPVCGSPREDFVPIYE